METETLLCLRCGKPMRFLMREDIQLGKQSFWHDWNHLLHGALAVNIYVCPDCGKLEFHAPAKMFAAEDAARDAKPGGIVALRCDACGAILPKGEKVCSACGDAGALLLPQIKCPACGALHDFDDVRCPYCKK